MDKYELICDRLCGFRVDSEYFSRKLRFAGNCCPRDNGPLRLVYSGTDSRVPAAEAEYSGANRRVELKPVIASSG